MADNTRYTGKVKSFNVSQGFGFIACPKVSAQYDNQDVYLHLNAVSKSGVDPSSLMPGMMVTFEMFMSPKGQPQANNLKVIGGGDGGAKAASKGKAASAGKGGSFGKAASAGKAGSSGKGASKGAPKGKGTAPPAGGVDETNLVEAVQAVAGQNAVACVLPERSEDGSPQIKISLTTLNKLLKAGGGEAVEGFGDVPDEAEGLPGFDGKKVEGPWFVGKLKEYFPDQAYGFVESATFKDQFGDKECFIHGDHLDPDGTGELLVKEGEEVIFPLVEDEDGNAWAWAPIIPKSRDFLGHIKSWNGGWGAKARSSAGFIHCEALWPVFEMDVYCAGAAAEFGGVDTTPGTPVVFNLHVNKEGKPQASSPRPVGADPSALPMTGFQPAKRRRVDGPAGTAAPAGGEWFSGVVKSFNDVKGFGFIDCAETKSAHGRDVFIHHAQLANSGGDVGSHVDFQVMLNSQGHPQAHTVYLAA